MARSIRIEFPDAVYHVTARGNERKPVFLDDADRKRFLETVRECIERFGVILHAYCLMPNHYHLLVQTPRANLSKSVGWLQTTYSVRFNHRWKRCGHLFQGRFKAHLVEHDVYAGEVIKYIHLNPVMPGDKSKPISPGASARLEEYRWSSHRDWAGYSGEKAPRWLCLDFLRYFGDDPVIAREEYRRRVNAMLGAPVRSPFDELKEGLVLGREDFFTRMKRALEEKSGQGEQRLIQRADGVLTAKKARALASAEKDPRISAWLRIRFGGERMADIAPEYGYRGPSGLSQMLKRLENKALGDPVLSEKLRELSEKVKACKSES